MYFDQIMAYYTMALAEAKSARNVQKTATHLAIACALIVAGLWAQIGFLSAALGNLAVNGVVLFVGLAVLAGALQLFLKIVANKGEYFDALTGMTHAFFPVAAGFLVTSLISTVRVVDLTSAMILQGITTIILIFSVVLGQAAMYKTLMELLKIDLLTAVISSGAVLLSAGVVAAVTTALRTLAALGILR